jgi:hypothetical protein
MSASKNHPNLSLRRLLGASLLLYQFFFFNILLPGHTRGAITLDGKHHPDGASCCCCCSDLPTPPAGSKQPPSQKDRENCAICNLAVRIMPTPIFTISLPPLTFLKAVDPDPIWQPVSITPISTCLERAPPSCA